MAAFVKSLVSKSKFDNFKTSIGGVCSIIFLPKLKKVKSCVFCFSQFSERFKNPFNFSSNSFMSDSVLDFKVNNL